MVAKNFVAKNSVCGTFNMAVPKIVLHTYMTALHPMDNQSLLSDESSLLVLVASPIPVLGFMNVFSSQ
jgi:hypothetical protein